MKAAIEHKLTESAKAIFEKLDAAKIIDYGPDKGKFKIGSYNNALMAKLSKGQHAAEIEEIKSVLKADFAEQEAAKAARRAKIDAIEGLKELQGVEADWIIYNRALDRHWNNERSAIAPPIPQQAVADVAAKYPRAAAYQKADTWAGSANHEKALAGKRAVERIINGEDHEVVIAEMDSEWDKAAEAHRYD